jgi:hypothetical protein
MSRFRGRTDLQISTLVAIARLAFVAQAYLNALTATDQGLLNSVQIGLSRSKPVIGKHWATREHL